MEQDIQMLINHCYINDIRVLIPRGQLDATSSAKLKSRLEEFTGHQADVIIDFTHVDFIDSIGLGTLIAFAKRTRNEKCDIKLACINDRIRRVLELTRVHQLFDIFDDIYSAGDSFERCP